MGSKKIEIASLSDPKYFEKVFKEHFQPLTFYAIKFTRDQDSAKEIVHKVFIKLWEKRESFSLTQGLKPYLYTSVHNRCLNYLRDRSKFAENDAADLAYLEELAGHDSPDIELAETEARINNAINKLPDKCRAIFKLNRFENKKYNDIAKELNISVKTVEGQISKALRILREELKDYLVIILCLIGRFFF